VSQLNYVVIFFIHCAPVPAPVPDPAPFPAPVPAPVPAPAPRIVKFVNVCAGFCGL